MLEYLSEAPAPPEPRHPINIIVIGIRLISKPRMALEREIRARDSTCEDTNLLQWSGISKNLLQRMLTTFQLRLKIELFEELSSNHDTARGSDSLQCIFIVIHRFVVAVGHSILVGKVAVNRRVICCHLGCCIA